MSLDRDSLSLVLSFLGSREFLSSLSVARSWLSAASQPTAWPRVAAEHLARQIAATIDEQGAGMRISEPASPRFFRVPTRSLLQPPHPSAPFRHATAARVELQASEANERDAIKTLACLPSLGSVSIMLRTCEGASLSSLLEAAADDSSGGLNPTAASTRAPLQALWIGHHDTSFDYDSPHRVEQPLSTVALGRLASLRVLVVDFLPAVTELALLTRLERLHFNVVTSRLHSNTSEMVEVMHAVRLLSTRHCLRSLAMSAPNEPAPILRALVEPCAKSASSGAIDACGSSPPPCGVVEFRSCWLLLDSECLELVCRLPALRRLDIGASLESCGHLLQSAATWSAPMRTCMTQLTHLRLSLAFQSEYADVDLSALAHCASLRSLILNGILGSNRSALDLRTFLPALGSSTSSGGGLRHLGLELDLSLVVPPAAWTTLAACTNLRTLALRGASEEELHLAAAAIATLPVFDTLTLSVAPQLTGASLCLSPPLVDAIAVAVSWRRLHLLLEVRLKTPVTKARTAKFDIDASNAVLRARASRIDACVADRFRLAVGRTDEPPHDAELFRIDAGDAAQEWIRAHEKEQAHIACV